MRPFLPKPFRKREKVLTVLAVVFALASAVLCAFAGLGAAFAYILLTAIGTTVFLIIGGRGRVFFTALFSFLSYVGNLGAGMIYLLWTERDARVLFDTEKMLASLVMFFVCVGVPVGLACLVTWFTAHENAA